MKSYDLVVIGAGSGGIAAARRAAMHGATVAICEQDRVGGTCVIRGCVPKKLMVYAAQSLINAQHSSAFGIHHSEPRLDFAAFVAARHAEIERLNSIYLKNLSQSGVILYEGRAVLGAENRITLTSSQGQVQHIHGKNILLAVGGKPHKLPIPGHEHALTSDDIWQLNHIPQRLLVLGAGYIGMEFASLFHAFGAQVSVSYRGRLPLRHFDHDVAAHLAETLTNKGLNLLPETEVSRLEKTDNGALIAHFKDGKSHLYDAVLMATGRTAHTEGLTAPNLPLEYGEKGEIKVNAYLQTNLKNVYAVGDVIEKAELTPVAIRDGRRLSEHLFNGLEELNLSYQAIPTAVFTLPPLGSVGLSETEAKKHYGNEAVSTFATRFTPMANAFTQTPEKTFIKLVVEKATDKVLGCHMAGTDAAEIIQGFAVAVNKGATHADFNATVALHPTSAEEFVLL